MSERKSLDGVFGSLKKAPPAVTPAPETRAQSAEAPTRRAAFANSAPQVEKVTVEPQATQARKPVSETVDSPTRPIVAYMAAEMKRTLRIKRFALEATNDEVLVAAFSEVSPGELTEHFAADMLESPGGGMPVKRRRGVRNEGGGEQQHFFLSTEQIDWLDGLRESVGAPSRSALIVAALERYFDRSPRT